MVRSFINLLRLFADHSSKAQESMNWLSGFVRTAQRVAFQETLSSRRFERLGNITKNTFVGQSLISPTRITRLSASGFNRFFGN